MLPLYKQEHDAVPAEGSFVLVKTRAWADSTLEDQQGK